MRISFAREACPSSERSAGMPKGRAMPDVKLNETNSTGLPTGNPYTVESEEVDVASLRPHPDNSYVMDDAEIEALAENIKEMGLIQPIAVREVADGGLQILSGHRRHRALCRLAKEDERFGRVPARVYRGLSDEDALLILHSSNISRNLSADERRRQSEQLEARVKGLRKYHPEWTGVATTDIIAQMLGMTGRTYRTKLKMARDLTPRLHERLERKQITQNDATQLAKLPEEEQLAVADALDRSQPKDRRQASAVIEEMGKPVSSYMEDFEAACRQLNVAYFKLREAMDAKGQPTYVDKNTLRSARAWIDDVLRS